MRISSKWGLALAAAVLSTGCYGSFSLTKKLYDFNGSVCGTEKGPSSAGAWGNEVVFLLISPAYGFCVMVDSLFLNSCEFWSGTNPMNAVTVSQLQDGQDVRIEKLSDAQMKLEVLENDVVVGTYTLDRTENGVIMHDAQGVEVAAR